MELADQSAVRTKNGIPVPDQPRERTYQDGLREGKQEGEDTGFRNGLQMGRFECQQQQRAQEQEKAREAATEARRLFWDTAYQSPASSSQDAKALAAKADTDVSVFISGVQKLDMKEFGETEKEVNDLYAAKQAAWEKNHKWWHVLDSKPESPMKVQRNANGMVSRIEFPGQGVSIPVTYWNSATEAAKLNALSQALKNANGSIERNLAQKSLVDELSKLKLPQLAQLAARKDGNPF